MRTVIEEVLTAAVLYSRMRGVCKQWKNLIETPGFAALHYTRHLPHVLGLEFHLYRCNPFAGQEARAWVAMEQNMDHVLNSSGGLLLGMKAEDFMVWNPLTGASKILPPLRLESKPCSKETAMRMDSSGKYYWICILVPEKQSIYAYDSGTVEQEFLAIYNCQTKTWRTNNIRKDGDGWFENVLGFVNIFNNCRKLIGAGECMRVAWKDLIPHVLGVDFHDRMQSFHRTRIGLPWSGILPKILPSLCLKSEPCYKVSGKGGSVY
ncbi:hypothetical protein SELMODRAFT_411059 [Selaginella moellendorffii]|uniref:F-box associated beta-propeller type 1 domain-containing protein n=1 Tax=Selaginella moellendorffii TaxID=88036 RepID=D8RGG5_SELML|nr:hypothetical protein SELMODRAFT_411059 [Selaginella moellendorffii]